MVLLGLSLNFGHVLKILKLFVSATVKGIIYRRCMYLKAFLYL